MSWMKWVIVHLYHYYVYNHENITDLNYFVDKPYYTVSHVALPPCMSKKVVLSSWSCHFKGERSHTVCNLAVKLLFNSYIWNYFMANKHNYHWNDHSSLVICYSRKSTFSTVVIFTLSNCSVWLILQRLPRMSRIKKSYFVVGDILFTFQCSVCK